MTESGNGNGRKPLAKMTAVELRQFARDHGLAITYLQQRRREDLLRLVREAMSAQSA